MPPLRGVPRLKCVLLPRSQDYPDRSKVKPFHRRRLGRQIDDNTKYRHIECFNRGDQSTQRQCRIGERPHNQDHGVGRGERQLRIDRLVERRCVDQGDVALESMVSRPWISVASAAVEQDMVITELVRLPVSANADPATTGSASGDSW